MNIVDRVKNILLKPKEEWPVIAGETSTVADLYTGYIIPLAAIPAVALFIGWSVIGLPFIGRVGMVTGLTMMITQYVMALVGVFVLSLVIDALAPNFGGEKNQMQALKVAAYSMTAAWVAGIFQILPMIGFLGALLGLYSLYLLFLGLPVLMKVPAEKAVAYTVVVIVAAIVIWVIVGAVSTVFMPTPQLVIPRLR
jgi:Yip1 domain